MVPTERTKVVATGHVFWAHDTPNLFLRPLLWPQKQIAGKTYSTPQKP